MSDPAARRNDGRALGWLALVSLRKLASDPDAMTAAQAILCGSECGWFRRAQTAKRRLAFVGGRLAAKAAVNSCRAAAGETALPIAGIEIARGASGAPEVRCAGLRPSVSISHSRHWAVAVAALRPCGVDVEDEDSRLRASDDYFDHRELSDTVPVFGARATWTAKEAVAKVGGRGLGHDPHSVRIVYRTASRHVFPVEAGAGASGEVAFAVAFGWQPKELISMGQEARGKALIDGTEIEGRFYLETDELTFRGGGQRLTIALKDVKSAAAKNELLLITAGRTHYRFEIGAAASRWANKIANPRTLVQKLGVKPDSRIAYLGGRDAELLAELEGAAASVSKRLARHDYDLVFVGVDKPAQLALLEGLNEAITPVGGVWVIFPKGLPDLKAETIIPRGKACGLVDNKIARISDRLTGMKFVIPIHLRK